MVAGGFWPAGRLPLGLSIAGQDTLGAGVVPAMMSGLHVCCEAGWCSWGQPWPRSATSGKHIDILQVADYVVGGA